MEKEYIVTLKKGIDPVSFQKEMVANNMLPYIPERPVTIANARPGSIRNTHYLLTEEEAEQLKKDARVFAVELDIADRTDIIITPHTTQTGDFTKTTSDSGDFVNWGLRRMIALSNPYLSDGTVTGGFDHTLTGEGVDFIVQDSGIQADHPEFQDTNGNSRVQEIDWYAASGLSGTMPEGHYTDYDGHGTHCAGIAAGKTYGWAKNARIYSIKIAGLEGSSDPNTGIPISDIFDIIKLWHRNKPIDPSTGVKRPTVVNMSWGYFSRYQFISGGNYRGTNWTGSSRNTAYGMTGVFDGIGYQHPIRIASVDADVEELIDEGVNVVIAAGNSYHKIADENDPDYNNYYNSTFYGQRYYHRGASPYSTEAIIVGAIDSALDGDGNEQKATFSNAGPGVDVYAPGVDIMSATSTTNKFTDGAYPLNNAFRITNISGTSMAAPQIAGIVATYGEVQPNATPANNKTWVTSNSKAQIDVNGNTGSDYTNQRSLWGGYNRYAFQEFNDPNVVTIAGEETITLVQEDATPTYALTTSTTSVNEGQSFTITLQTTNLVNGTIIPYTISGVSTEDIGGELLSGNFIVGVTMVKTFTATEDNTFDDGNETFTLSIDGTSTSVNVTIADTSSPDPSYALSATRTNLGEGESTTITLTADNVLSGTSIPYTITGVSSEDISGEPLTGNFTVGSDMSRTYQIAADGQLEGLETLNFALNVQGIDIDITINDTSNSPTTYNLVASVGAVNEGQSFTVDLIVDNPINGVQQDYIITGVDSTDIGGASLTGSFIVGSATQVTINVSEDFTTEGEETFVISLASVTGVSASVTINDTSTTLVQGQEPITTPGSGTFTVPQGVTSLSILAVGGGAGSGSTAALGAGQLTGGGGAGGTGWLNNITVTAGQVISYTVGAGGIGANNGGDTSFTIGSNTYTIEGGKISSAQNKNGYGSEAPMLDAGVAGGLGGSVATGSSAFTGYQQGGQGGWSYPYAHGKMVIGGGGGGSGTGGVGDQGFPQTEVIDGVSKNRYQILNVDIGANDGNWKLAPGARSTTGTQSTKMFQVDDYNGGSQFLGVKLDNRPSGTADYDVSYPGFFMERINRFFADNVTSTWDIYDSIYIVFKQGAGATTPRYVARLEKTSGRSVLDANTMKFQDYSADASLPQMTYYIKHHVEATGCTFESVPYTVGNGGSAGYIESAGETIYSIEYRGGANTGATYANTTSLGEFLVAQGDQAVDLNTATVGSGGGHTFIENWQSGTGTVRGGHGGGANLTRGLSGLSGARGTSRAILSITGAGDVYQTADGAVGNEVSSVSAYEVGAGAGGIGIMGLAPAGSQSRAETGQDGGLLFVYPGSQRQFNAPTFTLNKSKDSVNEGSQVSVSITNNLTEDATQLPIRISGIQQADTSSFTPSVTWTGDVATTALNVLSNSINIGIAADNLFDGIETMTVDLYNPGDTNYSGDVVATTSIVINDTSDGTQVNHTGTVVNSGNTGYTWTAGSDRNGIISGLNPNIVIDQGDTISWTVNAPSHPFYLKENQVTGTASAVNNVQNNGTTSAVIEYTPTVDGRKYYQCSVHNSMHGEIYISKDHWITLGLYTPTENREINKIALAGRGYTITAHRSRLGSGNRHFWEKVSDRGSTIYNRTGTDNIIPGQSVTDASENHYLAYTGEWNWKTQTPAVDYPSKLYVTKTNSSGANLWYRTYADSDGYAYKAHDIKINSSGNLIVVGTLLNNSATQSAMFIMELDITNGDVVRQYKAPPSDRLMEGYFVECDGLNDQYVVYGREKQPSGTNNEEFATRLWKFSSTFALLFARWYYLNDDAEPSGLALKLAENGSIDSIYIGVTDPNTWRSHVIKLDGTTGLRTNEWQLNSTTRTSTYPVVNDIAYDSVNDKVFAVGKIRSTATGSDKMLVTGFNDSLTENEVGIYTTDQGGGHYLIANTCAIDNTLDPNNRLFVGGYGISVYNNTAQQALVASVPINPAPTPDDQFDQFTYTEVGQWSSVNIATSSIDELTVVGITIGESVFPTTAGATNGTVTNSSDYTWRKMPLDYSTNIQPEAPTPTYALSASATSVNEGQSFTVTLDTTNVPDGTNVPYTITGVSSADIGGVSLTGTFTVLSNSASVTINVTADNTTD